MERDSPVNISKQKQEMASLRRSRRNLWKVLAPAILILLFYSMTIESKRGRHGRSGPGGEYSWLQDFEETQAEYTDWLLRRGTSIEVRTFQTISGALLKNGLSMWGSNATGLGFFNRFYLSLQLVFLRLSFFIIASFRAWIVLCALGFVIGLRKLHAYRGDDLLGHSGNGRVFYSGIRVDLSSVDSNGMPSKLIPGLACPKHETTAATLSSELGQLLQKWEVTNETNVALASIILAYSSIASYAPTPDEVSVDTTYTGSELGQSTPLILDRALMLHEFYTKRGPNESPPFIKSGGGEAGSKITLTDHIVNLGSALHRALTPAMRKELASFPREEIATLVLSYEVGKVMGYSNETGRWIQTSSFLQLCGRAILHSIPAFGREYTPDRRTRIRQALVYASRFSAFGPVRFPLSLSLGARAYRQWAEVLTAMPHELNASANEVELFGAVCEMHAAWEQLFFSGVMSMNPDVVEGVYATNTGLFFMPVSKLVRIFGKLADPTTLRRMDELVSAVSQMQRLQVMSKDFGPEGNVGGSAEGRTVLPAYQRIFSPLSHQEVKSFSELHEVSPKDVRDWSTIRVVLNAFGWLARRVGNNSVPEASIVFAVLKGSLAAPNAKEPIGLKGMIPLRGTKLEDKWGRFWHSRFIQVESASMAETKEDFEKLMSGIEETFDDEVDVIGA